MYFLLLTRGLSVIYAASTIDFHGPLSLRNTVVSLEARRYWLVCIGDAEEFQLLEAISRLWMMGCIAGAKNVLIDVKVTLTI